MALLETTVLLDEVKVVTADDDGALHLLLADDTSQNAATEMIIFLENKISKNSKIKFHLPNADIAGEWALLVDVVTLTSGAWGLEAEADGSHVALGVSGSGALLGVVDNGGLFLESTLGLGQFRRHFCPSSN